MATRQVLRRATALATLLALAAWAIPALRAEESVAGTWEGTYLCAQGATVLTLSLQPGAADGTVTGLFHFHATAQDPDLLEGCFTMTGTVDRQRRAVSLLAGRWLSRPYGYVTVDLAGWLNPDGDRMGGRVDGPLCTTFELHRVSPKAATPAACLGNGPVAAR